MDLLSNPFNILGATIRDNRQKLLELEEEKSLFDDSDESATARADLANPRKRLTAEIAWLPGVSPKQAVSTIEILKNNPPQLLNHIEAGNKLPALAQVNLLACAIRKLDSSISVDQLAQWICTLANSFSAVDIEQLTNLLNEERAISGFPEIADTSQIEAELSNRRKHCRKSIKDALDELPAEELVAVVTKAVDDATNYGDKHAPILIDDMVDTFEVEAQSFLKAESDNVTALVDQIRQSAQQEANQEIIEQQISQLEKVVKNWDLIAQPIQVSAKSRGLQHDASIDMGVLIRDLIIDLSNDYGYIELSKRLTLLQQEVFEEVDLVLERSIEDEIALDNLLEQRDEFINNIEQWANELTYETEIGAVFKDKLKISPDGISYKNKTLPLKDIIGYRWGGTKHSVNGIPTGTTFNITIGTETDTIRIELRKQKIVQEFVEKLWMAVGIRLLTELLDGLGNGQRYQFGTAIVDDKGMELEQRKLFGKNERKYCPWSELVIWNGAGTFGISQKDNRKMSVELSYLEDDNAHILESAIRLLWDRGGSTLSSVLSG